MSADIDVSDNTAQDDFTRMRSGSFSNFVECVNALQQWADFADSAQRNMADLVDDLDARGSVVRVPSDDEGRHL